MADQFNLAPKTTPLVVLAEGCFGTLDSKTAMGVIRYGEWPILAVVDSTQAGKSVREVTGINCNAPVVASLADALLLKPKALLLGTAPQGGELPFSWRHDIILAIERGLHIISGLHTFLNDDARFVSAAREVGVVLWDVRAPGREKLVAERKLRPGRNKVVTVVGSDCCVGKMFTALELHRRAQRHGWPSHFLATGQTGIMISGEGIPLDAITGDFMAGYVERTIFDVISSSNPDWIFVEGQGSLLHPGYSGVTMSLLHGSNPDALILCHNPSLTTLVDYDVPMLPLKRLVEIYEEAASWINGMKRRVKVAGISLNCSMYGEAEARAIISNAEAQTGLPVTDPVRYGVGKFLDNLPAVLYESRLQSARSEEKMPPFPTSRSRQEYFPTSRPREK